MLCANSSATTTVISETTPTGRPPGDPQPCASDLSKTGGCVSPDTVTVMAVDKAQAEEIPSGGWCSFSIGADDNSRNENSGILCESCDGGKPRA
ncbi:unnamed protein product [Linum trigynum]|uniref:Uncharacterized protein n=1 Tax=Linum trigynum TaxID=586398 RepID=A0AAV2GTM1_9ROSI